MAHSSLILKSLDDFALRTYVGSNTPPSNSSFRRRLNQRSTPASSWGNCCPDHLFLSARRMLHCIALRLPDRRNGTERTVCAPHVRSLSGHWLGRPPPITIILGSISPWANSPHKDGSRPRSKRQKL